MTAGVGIPSGVTGIAFADLGLPRTRYSVSRAGVYRVPSGDGPAALTPGIVETLVEAMKTINSTTLASDQPRGSQFPTTLTSTIWIPYPYIEGELKS
jgi:hypothetical protein